MKTTRKRMLRTVQEMPDTLPRETAKQVLVSCRTSPVRRLLGLVRILHAQIGVAAQEVAHVGRSKQVKLDTRAFGAGRVERDQHLDHALIRARLRHDLEHEAQV